MIRITRMPTHRDSRNAYEIFIDGVCRGEIEENETKEFKVGKGKHVVFARIGKSQLRSPERSVDVSDSIVELVVGGTEEGDIPAAPEHNFFHAISNQNRYLWLREKKEKDGHIGDTKKNSPRLPVQIQRPFDHLAGAILLALISVGYTLLTAKFDFVVCAMFAVSVYIITYCLNWRIVFEADSFTYRNFWRKTQKVPYDNIVRHEIKERRIVHLSTDEKTYRFKREHMDGYRDLPGWNEFLIWLESRLGEHKKEPGRK